MEFESDISKVEGTYIFHNEMDQECNHVLQLRSDKTFYQTCHLSSNKKNLDFIRMGKYTMEYGELEFVIDSHHKTRKDDESKDSKGKKFKSKIDKKNGDLTFLEDENTRVLTKILTIKEPKEEYTVGEFISDLKKYFGFKNPFIYVKNNSKIINALTNPDLLFLKLLKPDPMTSVCSLTIIESHQGEELVSRRSLNVMMTIKEQKIPSNHDELMKQGGKCPVAHGEDSEGPKGDTDNSGECPFDHTQCKQQ